MAAEERAKGWPPRLLGWLALGFGAVILISVNLLAGRYLALIRADVTENRLFSITEPTRKVLGGLDDTVNLKLLYSRALGEQAPAYGHYAERVKNLLSVYEDLSGGKLHVQIIDPEPFSDAEDTAVAAGLQAIALSGNDSAYFGLIGSNLTDDQETIAFLNLDRAEFLEYDLTRMVLKLTDPQRKVVGLLSGLNPRGGINEQGQALASWAAISQLEDFYEVRDLGNSDEAVPDGIDVLVLLSPDEIGEPLAKSIDRFALSGKPVMVFADPFSELRRTGKAQVKPDGNLAKLLKSWGVEVVPDKAVGDISHARQVQYGSDTQPVTASYVVWMTYEGGQFDTDDPLFANVDRLVLATPGNLKPVAGATTTFKPLLTTSPETMLIDIAKLVPPDPAKLLQDYKPGGTALTVAARITGPAKAAFDAGEDGLKQGAVNLIVVGDADMLFDSFWAERRQVLGQTFVVPRANNADFLLNGLEDLAGGEALSGLRGRGVEARPFTRIEAIQRDAEQRLRSREQDLNQKLQDTQKRLAEIQSRSTDGQIILSDVDKKAILNFRQEVVETRKDLRQVRRELNADIERLQTGLMFLNIAAIPLLVVIGGMVFALYRRRRKRGW